MSNTIEMCTCFDGPFAVEVRLVCYATNQCLDCNKPFIEADTFERIVQQHEQDSKEKLFPTAPKSSPVWLGK
ncbi:hypothetical protein CL629_02855 [bacterium]|nr:hypothetical protein [bacterium]